MAIHVFETTLQKTHEWLRDLAILLGWSDEQKVYLALKGTLHALRDRLPIEVSAKLSSQLPMLIRGFYYEGWTPASTPVKVKTSEEFLDLVATHFNNIALMHNDVERIVQAVFQVMCAHVSAGEIDRIKQSLPVSILELWPSSEYSQEQERKRRKAKQSIKRQYH